MPNFLCCLEVSLLKMTGRTLKKLFSEQRQLCIAGNTNGGYLRYCSLPRYRVDIHSAKQISARLFDLFSLHLCCCVPRTIVGAKLLFVFQIWSRMKFLSRSRHTNRHYITKIQHKNFCSTKKDISKNVFTCSRPMGTQMLNQPSTTFVNCSLFTKFREKNIVMYGNGSPMVMKRTQRLIKRNSLIRLTSARKELYNLVATITANILSSHQRTELVHSATLILKQTCNIRGKVLKTTTST